MRRLQGGLPSSIFATEVFCVFLVMTMLHTYRPYETCSLTLFAQADLSGTRDTRKNRREKRRALMTKTISVPKRLLSLLFDS